MKKYLYLVLLPLLLMTACNQRTTTTTTSTDPNTGQQVTQTTTTGYDNGNAYSGYNQSYQVVNNGGVDYALVMLNGVQQYILYSQFQQCMALGGYGYLNTYYGLHPGYFHNYGSNHWGASRRYQGGYYGSYYSVNHIDASVYAPRNRVQVQGTNPQNGQRGPTGTYGLNRNPGSGGMRNGTPAAAPLQAQAPSNQGSSGMRNVQSQPQSQRQATQPQPQRQSGFSGMRSGGSRSSSGRR